jgi:hypothetical protein
LQEKNIIKFSGCGNTLTKTKPYEHQRNALNESAEKNNWAYFMEMGTGKTKVTIDNIAYFYI